MNAGRGVVTCYVGLLLFELLAYVCVLACLPTVFVCYL